MKVLLPTVLLVFLLAKGRDASNAERDLQAKLMTDYNPTVRPVENPHDAVIVDFQIALQQIIDLDEKNQLLTTSMYMTNSWKDYHLKWKPEDYENITTIRLPAKYVWKPDIYVYNSAVDSFDSLLQTNVIIHSDGTVDWLPPGIFKTTCDVNIQYFPFDEQKCELKFGAWTHQGDMIDMRLSEDGVADISSYYESGEWDFISMKGEYHKIKYGCCPDPFVDATYSIHIRRKTMFYIFNLIIPCVFVCTLTILIFVFPADAGERMTLGITVLLAMVVFLQLLADNLPPTGTIPLLGKYFLCSVGMVTLSVVASVFSMNLHHTNPSNCDGMPFWIELVFLSVLPKLLFMTMPRKFFSKPPEESGKNGVEGVPLVRVGERLGGWYNDLHENKDPATSLTMQLRHSEKQLTKMCGDLHDLVSHMKDEEEDDLISEKWKFAARVMDRFCLVFFIAFFILSTVFTIGVIPSPEA